MYMMYNTVPTDDDTHYGEICGCLTVLNKEDTVRLGVALGLKFTRLEGKDGIVYTVYERSISASWHTTLLSE